MFEPSIDGLRRAVAGAGPFEVGQGVSGSLLQGPSDCDDLAQYGWGAGADRVVHGGHQGTSLCAVGVAVGGDHALVDAPGCFYLNVLVPSEQGADTGALLLAQ